ncbi:transposase [Oceanospirillaceae bacterium ASx5O]|nr:transposase [Oceanospirillaceae bacterium ASx5O]
MISDEPNGYHKLRLGRFSQQNGVYLVTSVTEGRHPLFADWTAGCAAIQAFTSAHLLKDAELLCWVLMPDHVHWLLQLGTSADLARLVGAMKSASSRAVHRSGVMGPVWASGFHDRAIRKDENLLPAARYVVANPVRAGLVKRFGDYPFWDSVYL